MRSCNKPNKPNEAPNCDCAHQGLGGDWRENRGSSGGLEGGGIAQVVSMRGVFWGVRTHPQVPGSVLVCQDLPGGTGVLRVLTPTLGSTRTHFGVSGPTRGGEERGGGQGLGEPLSFWEYQDPFWSVIAHPGGAETHFEVSEPILDCQNQLQGSHCPYWCARVPFWGTTVHPGVPEPILGCQCPSGVPGHILAWRCPSWGIRICFGVPGLILGCHWLF